MMILPWFFKDSSHLLAIFFGSFSVVLVVAIVLLFMRFTNFAAKIQNFWNNANNLCDLHDFYKSATNFVPQ